VKNIYVKKNLRQVSPFGGNFKKKPLIFSAKSEGFCKIPRKIPPRGKTSAHIREAFRFGGKVLCYVGELFRQKFFSLQNAQKPSAKEEKTSFFERNFPTSEKTLCTGFSRILQELMMMSDAWWYRQLWLDQPASKGRNQADDGSI
jgi:hypothetical protein